MGFVKKYWVPILIITFLSVAYFALRLPNLTLQPIFADEAIYIRWAQVMRAEPTLRFLPLSDGKTPLFMWLMIPFFKVFDDPLYAGRFLSVLSGFLTFLGAIFLGWRFFNIQTALWAGFLIVITPMIVFFDRMALVDSMLSAFSIWSLNLALMLIKYMRIDLAFILGYAFGASLLTKPPGFFNILALPATLIMFNWRATDREKKILKLFGLWVLAIATTFVIYNILRLGPGFENLNARNQDYVFSPVELLTRPMDPFIPHINDLVDWLPKLLTIPTLVLTFLGIFLVISRRHKAGFSVLLWALLPLIVQMALLKTFTARYVLFSFPPLLLLAGWALENIVSRVKMNKILVILGATLVLMFQALYFNYYLLTDQSQAPIPNEERRGYLEDWTSGYGLKEIAQFLREESKNGKVIVGTEGSFGTLPDGLQIYLDQDREVVVIGGGAEVSSGLKEAALKYPTFFVSNKSRFTGLGISEVSLIKEYPKPKGDLPQDAILLFKVLPQ